MGSFRQRTRSETTTPRGSTSITHARRVGINSLPSLTKRSVSIPNGHRGPAFAIALIRHRIPSDKGATNRQKLGPLCEDSRPESGNGGGTSCKSVSISTKYEWKRTVLIRLGASGRLTVEGSLLLLTRIPFKLRALTSSAFDYCGVLEILLALTELGVTLSVECDFFVTAIVEPLCQTLIF